MTVLTLFIASTAFAQRNLKNIPDPDPEIERKSFIVAEGFEVNLFAADPKIAKPIQMSFDAQGRLWIASSEVYPQIKPGQQATDKILVVEDADGDGRADKTTVFADGLLIPTGVLPGDGGVYVANSTEILHLSDTDGDGRADRRRVVLSGFGTEDTHHIIHAFRWGHDGMLYFNQSIYIHSHVETPYGVRRLGGGGIWQLRPEKMRLEILCRGFVNPWGHHFDRWGQSFATDGAYGEGINYVFPGSVFVTAPGAKRRLVGLNPGSPKHCGLEIASGRHLPPDWQGSMITNDFRAHRVCRFVVSEDGSGYASRQQVEVIKTAHGAFRPIDVKMGPDGAIYIADWYNPIIQHGEVDFRDPRRDHVHGRIWRVTAKGRPLVKPPKLAGAPVVDLLDALKAPEDFTRLHAKLILKSRGAGKVIAPLARWVAALDQSDAQREHHRLEALWTYQSLDVVHEKLLEELLRSTDHRVRAAAMRVVSHWHQRLPRPLAMMRAGVADDHPRVRLESVRALAGLNTAQAAETAMLALDRPMDRFLDFALWQTMRDLEGVWLAEVQAGRLDFGGSVERLTFALRAVESPGVVAPLMKLVREGKLDRQREESVLRLIASLGGPKELGELLDGALTGDESTAPRRAALLVSLVEATADRQVKPAGDLGRLGKLLDNNSDALAIAAVRAIGAWKVTQFRRQIIVAAGNPKFNWPRRAAAIDALGLIGDKQSRDALTHLAGFNNSHVQRRRAIAALLPVDPQAAAREAVALLKVIGIGYEPIDPAGVIRPFLSHKEGPALLTAQLAEEKLKADVAKVCLRAVRSTPGDFSKLAAALTRAGNLAAGPRKLTPAEIQKLIADVAEQGDALRGEAIYRRRDLSCMKCHAIAGAGGRVGPDLVSIGASAPVDYLVDSLLEPNKKVKENFHSLTVITTDGKVSSGVPIRETKQQLVLRDAEDRQVAIPVAMIEERIEGRSLMPDGLVDPLTRAELVDLVRFLSELGKVGRFAVGREQLVRRWQSLARTPDAHRRLNRTSYDTAATNDPALTWQPAYSRVSGELPTEGLPEFVVHADHPPTSFLRFELDVTTAGAVRLSLGDTKGLTPWLDGKPTAAQSELAFDLARGRHVVTLAVDRQQRTAPLRVELLDVDGSPAQVQLVGGK